MKWLALVALVGCGRIGFDATSTDGGITADDSDGDGVGNLDDNCPEISNATQGNEDADRFGDVCDPCPIVPDLDPLVDQDQDGTTDACDPHPMLGGDTIVVFEGFTDPLHAGAQIDGTWSFLNGRAIVDGALDVPMAVTWAMTSPSETIVTHASVQQYFGNLTPRPVGVVHEWNAGTRDGVLCVYGIDPSNTEVLAIADNKNDAALTNTSANAGVNVPATFTSTRDGTMYHCEGTTAANPLDANTNIASTPNRAGMFSRSASSTFDYVMIVGSP